MQWGDFLILDRESRGLPIFDREQAMRSAVKIRLNIVGQGQDWGYHGQLYSMEEIIST